MNSDFNEVQKRVMEVVSRNAVFNADKVNENSAIRGDHGIDSIKIVELVVDLEDEFDIEVDTSSLSFDNFATISKITEYVMGKIA